MFRRLAVFLGGFDLDAAQAVAGGGDVERYQVLDQLTLLVDKSLVVADDSGGRTRYRLLETVRQYALEKLGESGEADAVRARHRDYYTAMAAAARRRRRAVIMSSASSRPKPRSTTCAPRSGGAAKTPISSWRWRWRRRCSRCGSRGAAIREGLAWFDAVLADDNAQHLEVAPAVRARALADKAVLAIWVDAADSLDQAQQALAIAREVDDPALLVRALTACGYIAGLTYQRRGGPGVLRRGDRPGPGLGRSVEAQPDPRLAGRSAAVTAGDPIAVRAAAEEGRDLADAIGDRFDSRECRCCLGFAQLLQGDLAGAVAQFAEVVDEAEAAHDEILQAGRPRVPGHRAGLPG